MAQSDAAAAFDWLHIEGHRAYLRPESEVTGNPADGHERHPPGTAGVADAVRYQFYASSDGHVLFMASERKFWRNFGPVHNPASIARRRRVPPGGPGRQLAARRVAGQR